MKRVAVAVIVGCVAAALGGACGHAPKKKGEVRRVFTLAEAEAAVAAFEAEQTPPSSTLELTLDEAGALEALRSDRIDAFAQAYGALKGLQSRDDASGEVDVGALALRAQLGLAWAEAELTVAEVMAKAASVLEAELKGLESRAILFPREQARLRTERARIARYRELDEALRILAAEKVESGARDAAFVIAKAPEDYVGYRVAADAARLRNQWRRFDEFVKHIELHNPDSNGLRFLRGAAAWLRDGDAGRAAQFYREALEHDPGFVRAQAQLVLVAPTVKAQRRELLALKAIAPDHQIVRWAGPGIEAAYANYRAHKKRKKKPAEPPAAPAQPATAPSTTPTKDAP